jgi:hypothetical protein
MALSGFPVLCSLHSRFEGAAALEQRALERRFEWLFYAGFIERHPILTHRLHESRDFARGVGWGMHQHQAAHGHGVVRHVAAIALRVAHPQRQGPVREIELWQIGVVLPEQAVEERDLRLNAPGPVHPHPFAIEFGPYGLSGNNRAAAAALGELPDYDLGSLGIRP